MKSGIAKSKKRKLAFNSLLERLEKAKEAQAPADLLTVVSPRDLNLLLNIFNNDSKRPQTRQRQKLSSEINKVPTLKAGESVRLKKEDTHLPRTMTVLCEPEGELALLAETKSKLANGKKRKLPEIGGAFKKGKPSWRLDNYTEYFNLVTEIKSKNDEDSLRNEVQVSQTLASEYVNQNLMGPIYEKNAKNYASIYSIKANGNLYELIHSGTLSEKDFDSLTLQLLEGIKYIHDKDYIYQDLKSTNILVYGDAQTGYRLKITDFGNASHNGVPDESLSTWDYASPEILGYYKQSNTSQYHYYHFQTTPAYGNNIKLKQAVPNSWGQPDKTNDIWALAIMIFEMRHARFPTTPKDKAIINKDPLLSKMLEVNRKDRITIDQAIEIHQTTMKQKANSKIQQPKRRKITR